MKRKINIENWNRKDHFELFRRYEEPYFGLVFEVNCTKAYQEAKQQNISFFISYLHKLLKAINQIEEFRYRIINDEVYCFDIIHGSTTVARKDHTFGFSYIPYIEDFDAFSDATKKELERVKKENGLELKDHGENIVHFTAIPWLRFLSLSHPRKFSLNESIPKISTGKLFHSGNQRFMPVAIHAHHGLVDGYHVSQFYEVFQTLLDENG